MVDKITLTDLASLQNENTALATINDNNATIETAFNNTLSRDGTSPNQMENNLDLNNFQILNLPAPATGSSPLRLADLEQFVGGTLSNLPAGGTTSQALVKNSNVDYDTKWGNTTTSVGLTANSDFTVTNSPITTAGNINLTWANTPTGTGSIVKANAPSLVTPNIGDAVANTVKINGSTLSSGSSAANVTVPNSTTTLVGRDTIDTLTNKSIDAGQLTGTLAASQFPAMTGNVTSTAGSLATTIANNVVTNAMQANTMPAGTIKSNVTAGTAGPSDNTLTAVLDKGLSTTQGSVAYRNASQWTTLSPGTNGQLLATGGPSANPSWITASGTGTVTSVATAGLATGGTITSAGTVTVTAATKTDQQTGTSTTTVVTPAQQQSHDSAAKAWGVITQSAGTYTLAASYGVASISKTSTGIIVVTLSTAMASTTYAVVAMPTQTTAATTQEAGSNRTTTTFEIRIQSVGTTPALTDSGFSFTVYGRQ